VARARGEASRSPYLRKRAADAGDQPIARRRPAEADAVARRERPCQRVERVDVGAQRGAPRRIVRTRVADRALDPRDQLFLGDDRLRRDLAQARTVQAGEIALPVRGQIGAARGRVAPREQLRDAGEAARVVVQPPPVARIQRRAIGERLRRAR
jgi:hypothetical protein